MRVLFGLIGFVMRYAVKIINLILAEICPTTKLNSFHLRYFIYPSYNCCKFVIFVLSVVYYQDQNISMRKQPRNCTSFRAGNLHFAAVAYKAHKARWLHQQCNTNRWGQYTLQSLFFYHLPITKNKSKNIILLSLKLSEIARLIFQLPLVPSTRPHVKYPSSLLLKYYNIVAGNWKVLINPVSGKYFVYYGLKTRINIFYTPHEEERQRIIKKIISFEMFFNKYFDGIST